MRIIKPSLEWGGPLTALDLSRIGKLVQHHMAHLTWGFYDVHRHHRDSRRWHGTGYNWWISFEGKIYEGRGFNVGAQVEGMNNVSLGIGYQGHFNEQRMTDAQVKAGGWLNAKLIKKLGLSVSDIVGHGDVAATECPGRHFRMNDLLEQVFKELGKGGNNVRVPEVNMRLESPQMQGQHVRDLQMALAALGYEGGSRGYYGPSTEGSVKDFQRDHGITVDGRYGPETQRTLREALKAFEDRKIPAEILENVISQLEQLKKLV